MQIGGAYAGGNNTKNDCPCNQDIQTDRKCSPEGDEDVSEASEAKEPSHGKIPVKKLVGQGAGAKSIEVTDDNIKALNCLSCCFAI